MYNISINRQTVLSKTSNFMLAFCDMGVYRPSLEFCIHFQLRDLFPKASAFSKVLQTENKSSLLLKGLCKTSAKKG